MLSAIAARKASQAANLLETSGTPLEFVEPVQSLLSSNPSSKRKPSSQKTQNRLKRKKKGKEREKQVKERRYFQQSQQEIFELQDDVIAIDSSDEQEDDSMSEDEGSCGVSFDSSYEEKAEDGGSREDSEDVVMVNRASTSQPLADSNRDILSSFQSTLNRNMFFLASDQVHNLRIPSSSDGPGTVLALEHEETLCFLGAYTFCVLQGSISLCGVTIAASRRAHRVFAPRSSPLPVLEGVSGIDAIGGLKNSLPGQLHSIIGTNVALVLLQELRTGVEGLGRVCRTFSGVFEPSRWQNNNVLGPSLQIPDVHMVRAHSNAPNPRDIGV